jgi:hypothetical protein
MKQMDLDWDGGHGGYVMTDHPTIYCHDCGGKIVIGVDKYYESKNKTIKESLQGFFSKKVKEKHICQSCHREEQLNSLV